MGCSLDDVLAACENPKEWAEKYKVSEKAVSNLKNIVLKQKYSKDVVVHKASEILYKISGIIQKNTESED